MKRFELASTIILASIGIGLIAVVGFPMNSDLDQTHSQNSEEVHEHALFHVVINGTEYNFAREQFQLEADHVHLENNKSDIVHKHKEGVTWNEFFNTIDVNYFHSNSTGNLCIEIQNEVNCGNGKLVINGEETENFDKVIEQGDNVLFVLDTSNQDKLIEQYMRKQLSPNYKPESVRGERL